jgi:hypothetical protein
MRPRGTLLIFAVSCLACSLPARPTSAAPNGSRAAPDAAAPAASRIPVGEAPDGCGVAKLTEGRVMPPLPARPKPVKGVAHAEPTFHTCFLRVTDHAKEGLENFSRHEYSRRQAFNADSSLLLTTSGIGAWYLYDAKNPGKPKVLDGLSGDAEPQWHPTDPGTLYWGFLNGGMQIMALDVRKNTSRVVIDLRGKLPWPRAARAWTKSEGSPSADGRFWGFQVETEEFEILGLAVWDAVKVKLVGSMPTRTRPDHVSMSPSGRWIVVSGDEDGTVAWAPDFGRKRPLNKRGEHSDLAIGADGHDVYVSVDYQNEGFVFMTDIDTGRRTNLFPTYVQGATTNMHFSGKAFDKPGWVLVSTFDSDGPAQWFMNKVFALELRERPRIFQIAAHHSAVKDSYTAEPHATVNKDFTRVLFNSNWGVPASNDVDTYMVRLPKGAFP